MAIQVGSVVQLKSGGPNMTVCDLPAEGSTQVTTIWFSGSVQHHGLFPMNALEEV